MNLAAAQQLSQEVVKILDPFCRRIEVAGSVRRRQPFPRDIDIVLIPGSQGALAAALNGLGLAKRSGDKIVTRVYKGVQVDVYIASPQTWACILLIRTGSKESNIRLTRRAIQKGWHLHADGRGLVDGDGYRIAGDTEEEFFDKLGLLYEQPWERG